MKLENLAQAQPQSPGTVPVHYLHELPSAEEERLGELFKTLDKDSNGRIDIHDLSEALKELGLSHQYAEVCGCTVLKAGEFPKLATKQ